MNLSAIVAWVKTPWTRLSWILRRKFRLLQFTRDDAERALRFRLALFGELWIDLGESHRMHKITTIVQYCGVTETSDAAHLFVVEAPNLPSTYCLVKVYLQDANEKQNAALKMTATPLEAIEVMALLTQDVK